VTSFFLYRHAPLHYLHSFPTRRSSDLVYRFSYDGNGLLQSVSAPGPDGVAPRTTNVTMTSGRLTGIRDPDLTTVSFGYDPKETRSEEHTSELQSRFDLVCRLLLEKKKK